MSKISSIKQSFEMMSEQFSSEQAAGESAVLQFDLTGEQASQWYLVVKDGELETVMAGVHDAPDMVMSISGENWLDIVNGKADSISLFMGGEIQISGDMSIAMKSQQWFKSL